MQVPKRLRRAVRTIPARPMPRPGGHRTGLDGGPTAGRGRAPCALPSYEQARAMEVLRLLRKAASDEPPTPRGQAP